MNKPDWKCEAKQTVHQNDYWKVLRENVRFPDGELHCYHSVSTEDSVLVLPILSDGSIVLVRQFRYLQQRWSIELPGGGINALENPEEAARRELLEECGCAATELRPAGNFAPCVGVMSESCYVFGASAELIREPCFDRWEVAERLICSPEEVNGLIRCGRMWSGMSITAWVLAAKMLDT